MSQRYYSTWWSIALPNGWNVERDEECTTIYSDVGVGTLQLSAFERDSAPITDQDLTEFALGQVSTVHPLTRAKFGDYRGFQTHFHKEDIYWKMAWLRNNSVILYATYNCPIPEKETEKDAVDNILLSLKTNKVEQNLV